MLQRVCVADKENPAANIFGNWKKRSHTRPPSKKWTERNKNEQGFRTKMGMFEDNIWISSITWSARVDILVTSVDIGIIRVGVSHSASQNLRASWDSLMTVIILDYGHEDILYFAITPAWNRLWSFSSYEIPLIPFRSQVVVPAPTCRARGVHERPFRRMSLAIFNIFLFVNELILKVMSL